MSICVIDREGIKNSYLSHRLNGLSHGASARLVGVHPSTIDRWAKQDVNFQKAKLYSETEAAREAVTKGLTILASGAEETTIKDEWVEEVPIEGTDDLRQIKKSKIIKTLTPNVAAIRMLANKYAKGEYEGDGSSLTIQITQKDRTLTLSERKKLLEHEGKTEDIEAIEAECKRLVGDLEL